MDYMIKIFEELRIRNLLKILEMVANDKLKMPNKRHKAIGILVDQYLSNEVEA